MTGRFTTITPEEIIFERRSDFIHGGLQIEREILERGIVRDLLYNQFGQMVITIAPWAKFYSPTKSWNVEEMPFVLLAKPQSTIFLLSYDGTIAWGDEGVNAPVMLIPWYSEMLPYFLHARQPTRLTNF